MFAAYTIAFWATVISIVTGILAIFSRWGSLITSGVSAVSLTLFPGLAPKQRSNFARVQVATLFTLAASITSSALYGTLVGTFKSVFKDYNIKASMGNRMMAITWLAVAFSLGASLFWVLSTCCCSGKSDRRSRKPTVEKTPYTYERVESPYGGPPALNSHGNVPLRDMQGNKAGTAYEPFRHDNRV